MKNKTANVEKNCVILQKREEILTQMLQKRETRDQSMKDVYDETLDKYVKMNEISMHNIVVPYSEYFYL